MSEKSLKASFIYNLTLPASRVVIALVTVPIYVHHLGAARYGVLVIAWALLGYFGFLDFGLSRAAANALAKLRNGPQSDRARVLLTVLVLNLGMSVIAAIALYVIGGYVIEHFISIPGNLTPEVVGALPWLASSLPLSMVAGVAIGAIESRERFLLANLLQILTGSLAQVVPVITAVIIGPSLTVAISVTTIAVAAGVLVTLAVVYRLEGPFSSVVFSRAEARALLGYGGWVSATNLASPFMSSADQMIIGSVLGVGQVPHYSVPMSLVMRLATIPAALGRSFFPRMSSLSRDAAYALASRSLSVVGYGFGAICALGIILAPTFFRYWMGADFAAHSGPVAQILFIGAWMNGLSFMAFTLLQGQGRPDLTGKLYIAEVVPYIAILWLLTKSFGINGTAIAWTLRCTIDALVMFWAAGLRRSDVISALRPALLLGGCAVASYFIGPNLVLAAPAALVGGLASIVLAYTFSDELRRLLILQLKRAGSRGRETSVVGRPIAQETYRRE
jgi:O-antigen/teichoic acid export membrane protein